MGRIRKGWSNLSPTSKVAWATLAVCDGVTWPFVGLKLAGVTTWSWWWVFSPIWALIGIAALAAAVMAVWFVAFFLLLVVLMVKNPDSLVSL